jgi:hypothetical protein
MDFWVYSSCVIAELFSEGAPIFSLSQLFKYRSSEYNPRVYLEKIEDEDIRVCQSFQFLLKSELPKF